VLLQVVVTSMEESKMALRIAETTEKRLKERCAAMGIDWDGDMLKHYRKIFAELDDVDDKNLAYEDIKRLVSCLPVVHKVRVSVTSRP
jgi:hypothetical protein